VEGLRATESPPKQGEDGIDGELSARIAGGCTVAASSLAAAPMGAKLGLVSGLVLRGAPRARRRCGARRDTRGGSTPPLGAGSKSAWISVETVWIRSSAQASTSTLTTAGRARRSYTPGPGHNHEGSVTIYHPARAASGTAGRNTGADAQTTVARPRRLTGPRATRARITTTRQPEIQPTGSEVAKYGPNHSKPGGYGKYVKDVPLTSDPAVPVLDAAPPGQPGQSCRRVQLRFGGGSVGLSARSKRPPGQARPSAVDF